MWADSKVLVTGGAGFVGSYLVEQLVAAGARVRVADSLWRGSLVNLSDVSDSIEFYECDLLDPKQSLTAFRDCDTVFHLAAKVAGVEFNRTHHAEMLDVNLRIAAHVMSTAVRYRVARVLVVSSACVYPQDALVPTPESEGFRGTPEPANEGYGWAKRMAEKLADYYSNESDVKFAVVRPFNAYGPRERFEGGASHVIPSLIGRVLSGEDPLIVWGSGRQTRSFLHAADLATGMRLVAEKGAGAGPVNVASDREVTIAELVALVCDACDRHPDVVFDTTKPEGHLRRAADLTQLREVTGWTPAVSLEDGLRETVAAYRAWVERHPT